MYIHYSHTIKAQVKVEKLGALLCQPQKEVLVIVTSCFIRLIQFR